MENILKLGFALTLLILTIIPLPEVEEIERNCEDIMDTIKTEIIEIKDDGPYNLEFKLLRGTEYQPVPEQCNEDPLHTANMTKVSLERLKKRKQHLCAFSNDVIEKYDLKFNDKFEIWDSRGQYLGRFTFCDRMNARIQNTCDMMIHPEHQPHLYKNITVKRVKPGC